MDRRDFIKIGGASVLGLAMGQTLFSSCEKTGGDTPGGGGGTEIEKATGHFTLQQVSSTTSSGGHPDQIGNSYIIKTDGGKVIVMDGGLAGDESHLRDLLMNTYGGTVDQWWLTHPHGDHAGAMLAILKAPKGITVKEVYYSRFTDALLATESGSANQYARPLYELLDKSTTIKSYDLQTVGGLYEIDGILIKVLGVSNPELLTTEESTSPYNNSSIILRIWDKDKSFLFLGDAQQECGDKLLTKNSRFFRYLTVDYVQVAHHGQQGVKESFYKSITFKKALWPTPSWVFNPASGSTLQTERTKQWLRNKGIGDDKWIVSCLPEYKDYIIK